MDDSVVMVSCALVGTCVFCATFFGRDYFWQSLDWVERDLSEKLRALHVSTARLRAQLVLWLLVMLVSFVGLAFVLDSFPLAILTVIVLMCAPWYLIGRMAAKRRLQVELQLADAMVTFSSAVKAGLSLAQAIEILADQSPRPVCEEFRQIIGEYKMGKPLERTLTEAKTRMKSENFSLFAAAVLASRQSGGKLNDTVDRIAHSVLELQRLERKVQVETAQARKSAVYMALAPFLIMIAYYFVDPESTGRLFTTVPGQLMLTTAIVFDIAAFFWARAILQPEI